MKAHFSDSSTSALPKYQSQEGCQEQDPPSHYPYLFHKPNKKGTLDIQGKKSLSSHKSVKNAQKRQGINVRGVRWVRRGEAARAVV